MQQLTNYSVWLSTAQLPRTYTAKTPKHALALAMRGAMLTATPVAGTADQYKVTYSTGTPKQPVALCAATVTPM